MLWTCCVLGVVLSKVIYFPLTHQTKSVGKLAVLWKCLCTRKFLQLCLLENLILIMKSFAFPSQFCFPKVWLSHPLTELLPNHHLRCHQVINPIKPQASLPCNILRFLAIFYFKAVIGLTTLHSAPLFSDSKFVPKNSPSLWFSPEAEGH